MSDSEDYASPPAKASTSKKRKLSSKATTSTKSKRTKKDPFADAKDTVRNVLASPDSFTFPEDDDELRRLVVRIAEYAQSLEGVASAGKPGLELKTTEEIAKEAERVVTMIKRGIKKQMSWKPSCKGNNATYVFDGVCPDPRVFGAVLRLDGPPTFKAKKYTKEQFQYFVGLISSSARYSTLRLTSDINVHWSGETGVFKISGRYGVGY